MVRIKAIDPDRAEGKRAKLLEEVRAELGEIPNFTRVMANSPEVLEAYLIMQRTLAHGSLSPKLCEQLRLFVSSINNCRYSVAAHAAIGRTIGISEEELRDSHLGVSPCRKTEAALHFTRKLIERRGHVNENDLEILKQAGFSESNVVEIIAQVALTAFTNYLNNAADTAVDFPLEPISHYERDYIHHQENGTGRSHDERGLIDRDC